MKKKKAEYALALMELGRAALMQRPYFVAHPAKLGEAAMEQCRWCHFQSFVTDNDRDRHRINCIWVAAVVAWEKAR